MLDTLKNVKILGISCCVPQNTMDTDELENHLDIKEVRKFKRVTGVKSRHVCHPNHIITAGDLCYEAAEKLINELNVDRKTINAVILVTQSSDYRIPSTACLLQHRLGLSEETVAYDVNLGCSGYIYGLHIAATYLQSGLLKKVLLLAGEADVFNAPIERRINGEAGSATLIEHDEAGGQDMSFLMKTMGSGFRSIIDPYGRYRHGQNPKYYTAGEGETCYSNRMDGIEVFKFATREASKITREYMDAVKASAEDFDIFAYHQSNKMIIEEIARKVSLSKKKCPISLDIYGNTNAASIPLAICDYFNRLHCEEKSYKEKNILACGYGIGLSLGVTSFMVSGDNCLPVITTDKSWDDGLGI